MEQDDTKVVLLKDDKREVVITDIDIPFWSLLRFLFRLAIALLVLWLIIYLPLLALVSFMQGLAK